MDISIYFEESAQVSVAFIFGAVIGLKREFRSK
jgi:putative Mg2+ transporter-C (MgtC) family protein